MSDFSVEDLQKTYRVGPFSTDENKIECSVGGALCLEMLSRARGLTEEIVSYASFPSAVLLADFLAIANSRCGEALLLDYANDIFQATAEGKLDEAWDLLDQALNEDN